jgi:phosphatidate cytidylyltransferase
VTGSPVSPALLALAAFAAGAIRLVGMAPLRSAPAAFPEAVLLAAGVAYTAGLLSFLDRLLAEDLTRAMVVVLVSKTSDVCGYLVGSTIGRKRIVPAVSPKKTWEGTIAGVLGSAGVAGLLSAELAGPPWFAACIGALIGAASFLGDLTASGLKRWSGAKDSAQMVPEFGGFLDMVDGILLAAPVAVLCLHGW